MNKTRIKTSFEHSDASNRDKLVVNWLLSNLCNYSCHYCPKRLHDGTRPGVELKNAVKFSESLLAQSSKKIYFEFVGGEPTVYPGFLKLIQTIKTLGGFNSVVSNGARPISFWQKCLPSLDHVCLSFHIESANQDRFFNLIKLLAPNVSTHVNIMMLPEKFNECLSFAGKLSKEPLGISVSLQKLYSERGLPLFKYDKKQMFVMENQTLPSGNYKKSNTPTPTDPPRGQMKFVYEDEQEEVVSTTQLAATNKNSWRGWSCSAGIENLAVDFEGNISRGRCLEGGVLGNISQPFLLPTTPVVCSRELCQCEFDIMCTKKRIR